MVLFNHFFSEPMSEDSKRIEIDDCLMSRPCHRFKRLFEVDIGQCPANQIINGCDPRSFLMSEMVRSISMQSTDSEIPGTLPVLRLPLRFSLCDGFAQSSFVSLELPFRLW